jgi:hypothetical protein
VVVFSADANGADLTRGAVDVNLEGRAGDLTIVDLTPGARYSVRMGLGGGRVQRIAILLAPDGGVTADAAGMVRLPLDAVSRLGAVTTSAASTGGLAAPGASASGQGALDSAAGAPAGSGSGTEPVHPHFVPVKAEGGAALAEWDARVTRMLQSGQLRLRETASDALIKGRTYQRLTQIYKGVPVFGGDLTRSLQGGRPVAVYGALYGDIDVETEPGLTADEAAEIFVRMTGSAGPAPVAELMVLPTDDGSYLLTYRGRVPVANDVQQTFIDASTGDTVLAFSDLRKPAR